MPRLSKLLAALVALTLLVTACSLSPARAPRTPTPSQFKGMPATRLPAVTQNAAQPPAGFTGFMPLIQRPQPAPTATPGPVRWVLQARQYQEHNADKNVDIQVRVPEIAGGSADAHILGFNREVQALVDQNLSEIATWVGAPLKDPGGTVHINYIIPSEEGWKFTPHPNPPETGAASADLSQMAVNPGHSLVSARLVIEVYLGGAHPNTAYYSLNYDLVEGRSLSLADLFKPGSAYLERLSSYCLKKLRSREDVWLFNEKAGTAPEAMNYTVWNVTPDGLLITFNEYQVAIYASGPQFVLVPYSKLKDLINPDGPLSQYAK